MATLDQLADDLERSHTELQDRLADPAVYADHREAAELGRRLKELEPAVRAAREWRRATADLAEAKDDHEHSEFHAQYTLECQSPVSITGIEFPFFRTFAGAEKLEVNVITAKGQNRFEVSRKRPSLSLAGMI